MFPTTVTACSALQQWPALQNWAADVVMCASFPDRHLFTIITIKTCNCSVTWSNELCVPLTL